MSSFLVSNETLGAIAATTYRRWTHDRIGLTPSGQLVDLMRERKGEIWSAGIERLARGLYEMNIRALRARYDDRCEELIEPFEPRNGGMLLGVPQLYKAVQCLLYQCSEGKVPKELLFQDLEAWGHQLAHHLAMEIPEVKAAQWS